jgi:UrcA family protein
MLNRHGWHAVDSGAMSVEPADERSDPSQKGSFLMNMNAYLRRWTIDPKAFLRPVALAAMLAVVANSVLAESPSAPAKAESVAATVSLADLDISTPDGIRSAHARLARVAQHLCRKLGDNRKVSDPATYADCCRETLANALRQLNVPVVADLPRPNLRQH